MEKNQILQKTQKKALLPGMVIVLFFSLTSNAAISAELILCKNDKTVRTIRVEVDHSNNICKTIYTKSGIDSVVGSGQYSQSCDRYADNVRKNLEAANWECREVQEAKSSGVTEL